ncbi:EmrB/QacA family drug resistance transporter [Streptomyces abikoensis]
MITERAGLDLRPAASWMLLRMNRYGSVEPSLLAERADVPLRAVTEAAIQLEVRGLARREGLPLVLTDEGRRVAERLFRAREESLAELLGDWWTPDRPTDLDALVRALNIELCGSDAERPQSGEAPRRDHEAWRERRHEP